MQLQNLSSKKEKEIIEKLTKHPLTFFIVRTSGRFDFYIGLACKGIQHFDKVLREVYTICGNKLVNLESVAWIKDYKYTHTIKGIKIGTFIESKRRDPSFSRELFLKRKEYEVKEADVDNKDLQILKFLSDDPRIELKKLGIKVNLTGEAVRNRIKNLIDKDVILGFTAVPNYFNLGYQTHFLLIQAKNLTGENERLIESFLQQKEYTIISFKVIGHYDILISVSVKDLNEFNEVLIELRDKFSNIIKTYESLSILDWYKYTVFPEGIYS